MGVAERATVSERVETVDDMEGVKMTSDSRDCVG